MTMIQRTEENLQGLLGSPGRAQTETVWQKMQKNTALQKDREETVVGKAAEVFISKEGRKLSEDSREPLQRLGQTDFMTEGEKKLRELLDKKTERQELSKQADDLEKRLKSDDTLTDDERSTMQQKIDELREQAKSPTEKLHEAYQKKFALEEQMDADRGSFLPGDMLALQKQILLAEANIRKAEDEIKAEGMWQEVYEMQSLKERADLSIARSRADYLGKEIDFRSSELSMSVRTAEQVQAQAEENGRHRPTAADVVQAAVEEGKARAEKAEDPIGKLADSGRDSALTQLEQTTRLSATATADETSELLELAKAAKKITKDDAMG